MTIVFHARFEAQIHNLIDISINKGYLAFEEDAIKYAE